MTGSQVRLAQLGPLSSAVVSALHGECFEAERWDECAVAEIFAMPGSFGFVALTAEDPAGFIIARVAAGECEILSLGVRPASRQAGLGRRLLKATLSHAAASGAQTVFLEVAEDNAAAHRLYESVGFAVIGRRQAYYRRGRCRGAAALVLGRKTP